MTPVLLHQLLASSAARFPQHPALVGAERTLTYAELDALSNRIANLLQRHGVRRGDRVGLHLEKSADAVAALYGVLKAGAAYVPLDPKAPARRTAFVIENCAMQALVCSPNKLAALEPVLAHRPACIVVTGDAALAGAVPWSGVAEAPATPPADPLASAEDLAYILYTSGSTGEPKGVMLSHRAALAFVTWAAEYFALVPEDRLSSHAPLHFDLSVFDLFAAAAAGASVVPVPAAASMFPRGLAQWIEEQRITVWYSVPSVLVQLSLYAGLEKSSCPSLRAVLFAGEPFPVEHLRCLMERVPRAAYFNLYGPTETNVCTVHAAAAPLAPDSPPLPIGRACAGSEVFAVGDAGGVAAPGETGELYVRGPTLMHGYWGRPEKTAEVLAGDPRGVPGLAYRTGDLVRQDASGQFHFIGRRDAQVKSRGYRIELGDVESVLGRHQSVAEAAVVTRPHAEFGCVLRGVVALRAGATLTRKEIAAFCAQYLPPYMIPDDFAFLARLPKTSTGKLDRARLQKEQVDG